MNLLMKGAALAPPFSCTTKYSSDVYSPRPPDIRVRLLPTKPPVHFTTEQPGRDRYYVDTAGKNTKKIAEYIQNQLKEDQLTDQMTLKEYMDPLAGNK